MSAAKIPVYCLMGPTAAGKTPLAVELVQQFPFEIISVDSAMVYRGMDIGTAKPDAETLRIAPHHLIDICDPTEIYSAGMFRQQALDCIQAIVARGKTPLLVGGTMLYFRVLTQGLAPLPMADQSIRTSLQQRAQREGWSTLHAELALIDPDAALRIQPSDGQRIQRAMEVFMLTGKPISTYQQNETDSRSDYQFQNFIIAPQHRSVLHARIAKRFHLMLAEGFMDEVKSLYARGDLTPDLPAMRAVGYRQAWECLAGRLSVDEMTIQAITATRQLAKRQLTWLRALSDARWFDAEATDLYQQVADWIKESYKTD